MGMGSMEVAMQHQSPMMSFQPAQYNMPAVMPASAEKFRFHVTLNAPTAMIKSTDEIPITYLNKGQAYSISIVDTTPNLPLPTGTRYRTFIRISFEDEQQRQRPATCWQLWKEGRGTNEAHQRGGKLQAVEYVEANQPAENDDKRTRVDIDTASFDGFSVIWTPGANGSTECNIAVRFNFLSTDFSHSKGVKGIPVRLCTKTETVSTGSPRSGAEYSEICYCKVKLFRDHGAERKLSNDVAHVKKTIDKLKQQIAQIEAGIKDHGKRKRSGSMAKPEMSSRPGKVPKHKRTWSMSSASSTGNRGSHEDDLQLKLAALQDMFTSTRPQSVLYLKGEEEDDPDLRPVQLTGGDVPGLVRTQTNESSGWEHHSAGAGTSSIVSPTPSNQSLPSGQRHESRRESDYSMPPLQPVQSWQQSPPNAPEPSRHNSAQLSSTNTPVKVQKQGGDQSGALTGWIEALGVDYTYQPPPERPIKPVACFYVQPRFTGRVPEDNYYRAIYLMQRTLKDLVNGIASKCNVEPTKVLRTLRINKQGLNILLDDESVVELQEGQDMVAEFLEMRPHSPMKREWDSGPTDVQVDGDIDVATTVQSDGFELRLLY